MGNQPLVIQRTVKPGGTRRGGISKAKGIALAILMRSAVVGTNGIIAIGGSNVSQPSF